MNSLNHLAIIMDGNGRWAKKRGFLRTKGHEVGANVVHEVCEFCIDKGIKVLSLYAFSTENWRRPKSEVDFLLKLLKDFLRSQRQKFTDNGINFNIIGDISVFSQDLKDEISNLKKLTSQNKKLKLNLAINYGSKDEIIRAVKKLTQNKEELNEESLKNALDEPCDIDLLIRTGGEFRLSNFMLLQASYAEFAFTPTLWPDFNKAELEKIAENFMQKHRRYGGL
ncbi:MAG: di-trans,poly-cis-decaprenylcistransferase [Campylobacter sp.]|nr:di-trans,poly-cis-decaprenylcistransferase [Campylobacter sp.]